jgi:chromosome segregation ATPase
MGLLIMTDNFAEFDKRIAAANSDLELHRAEVARVDQELAKVQSEKDSLNTELRSIEVAIADSWGTSKSTTAQETKYGQILARLKPLDIVESRLIMQKQAVEGDVFLASIAVQVVEAEKADALHTVAQDAQNTLQQQLNEAVEKADTLGRAAVEIRATIANRKELFRMGHRNA